MLASWPDDLRRRLLDLDLREGDVAAFDADETLWHGDAGVGFFQACATRGDLASGGVEVFDAYVAARRDDEGEGLRRCATAFAGLEVEVVEALAEAFFQQHLLPAVYPEMLELFTWLESQGVEAWIVTASPVFAALPGGRALGVPPERVVGIQLAREGGRYLDRIEGPVTYRVGKPEALRAACGRAPRVAAGNGSNDAELLEAATDLAVAVNPAPGTRRDGTPGLAQRAQAQGWPVLRLEDPRPEGLAGGPLVGRL